VLISIYKGFTSPVEVSKNLLMDAGAMSRMLERMVKRDLVVRTTNPDDKRQVILGLTEKGRGICDRFQNEALASILTSLTERLTDDEAQQLVTLLIKMLPDGATQPYR
jgi:MarR family multiple antibiotic resistance transcriptional regulator